MLSRKAFLKSDTPGGLTTSYAVFCYIALVISWKLNIFSNLIWIWCSAIQRMLTKMIPLTGWVHQEVLNSHHWHWVAAANILTQLSSHFNNTKLDVINVSLVTLNNATLYNVYITYITHLICIYCTLYYLLHLAYAIRPSLIHVFICTYSYSFLYTCLY